jgi:hypothetical protein
VVEHFLGKEEVTSSSLVVGSIFFRAEKQEDKRRGYGKGEI